MLFLQKCDAFSKKNKWMPHFWLISLEWVYLHRIENDWLHSKRMCKWWCHDKFLCAWEFKLFYLTFSRTPNTPSCQKSRFIQTVCFFLRKLLGECKSWFFSIWYIIISRHRFTFWLNTDDWQAKKIVNESFILNIVLEI